MSRVWDFTLLKDKRTNRQIDGQREPNSWDTFASTEVQIVWADPADPL